MFVKYVGPHPIGINDPSTGFERWVEVDDVLEVPGGIGSLAERLTSRGDFKETERPKPPAQAKKSKKVEEA